MDSMIRGYHRAGWQVFLLAMHTSRHQLPPQTLQQLYRELYAFEAVDTDNRLRPGAVIGNLLLRSTPEHADRFHTPAFRERLEQILQSFDPHVIQLESIYLNTYLETFRQHSNALLVQRLHNIECQIWRRLAGETRNPVKRWYLRNLAGRIKRFEQEAWEDADLLLPITGADAAVIRDTGCQTELYITPFGIETVARAQAGAPEEQMWRHGYHIGAMDWRPNRDAMQWFIRDIWPEVHREAPSFRFSFAGRVMPDKLKRHLPEGVTCRGEVADAHAFIRDKQVLIVPLRSAGGIRVKILEAMAAGKLVISTGTGMQGIDAEPGIHYLRADTPAEFVQHIKDTVADTAAAQAIARQGQELVRKYYDRHKIMTGLLDKLEQAVAAKG